MAEVKEQERYDLTRLSEAFNLVQQAGEKEEDAYSLFEVILKSHTKLAAKFSSSFLSHSKLFWSTCGNEKHITRMGK